jgi:hypothetical protein
VLFAVAPGLLGDPELGDLAKSVIHGEQRFVWEGSIEIGAELEVTGKIARVRQRADRYFVNFDVEATRNGASLLRGTSTFLMSASAVTEETEAEIDEPPVAFCGLNDPIVSELERGGLRRSASRADLVRYAAATGDWNPIHWDHKSAVAAGLPGVPVHGLLQTAWLVSYAIRNHPGSAPIAEVRCRYRSPFLAGRQAGIIENPPGSHNLVLAEGDREIATATIGLR